MTKLIFLICIFVPFNSLADNDFQCDIVCDGQKEKCNCYQGYWGIELHCSECYRLPEIKDMNFFQIMFENCYFNGPNAIINVTTNSLSVNNSQWIRILDEKVELDITTKGFWANGNY